MGETLGLIVASQTDAPVADAHDYIIVGAGAAGCVLAERLTEQPHIRVLLVEAGGRDDRKEIRIPAAFRKLFKSECDWSYFTEPEACLAGRRLYWPRGKVLGGSTSINAMIYIRGHRWDYDQWAGLGCPGWNYAEVLPFFKKAEDNSRGGSDYHGAGGPLHVTDPRAANVLSGTFAEGAAEAGYARNPDFNGAEQEGFGLYQLTQRRGQRWSAADAYLRPAMRRPNLVVRTGTHVTRVLLENGRASGVECIEGGRKASYRAEREVILCGGTVNSPQLLMLSGIGPAGHLRSLGIAVAADLPGVGENLQDHLQVRIGHECTQPITLYGAENLSNSVRYLFLRTGPFTSNIAESGGFVRTSARLPAPDLQFMFGPTFYHEHGFRPAEGHGFGTLVVLLRPESRGRIRLRSADPLAPPEICANYLAGDGETELLIEGLKIARHIFRSKAFDPWRGPEASPGADAHSDESLGNYIRQSAETIYHPVGTCKMGTGEAAVVDPELRVRGIERLRVADASVMPTIPGGNTNAPTIMIAEKAASLVVG